MSEGDALLQGRNPRAVIYSGALAPIQSDVSVSRSLAASEYLVRKSKEDFIQPGIPIFRAIFIVMNGCMGAGILNFPQAFAKAGGVTNGMIIQMVIDFSLCLYIFIIQSFGFLYL